MKFIKMFLILGVISLLASCAAPRINPDRAESLKDSKIAVAYVQMEKRINHNESLYRVFWWDLRELNVHFDGLWDVDKELSSYIVPKFNALDLHTTSIYNVASKQNITDFHTTIADYNSANKNKPIELSNSLRQSLKRENIRYLVTLSSKYIYTHTQWGVRQMNLKLILSVIDVNSNEEIYPGVFVFSGALLKGLESVRELESNNLAGLKIEMKKILDQCISNHMPKALGLAQEDNA